MSKITYLFFDAANTLLYKPSLFDKIESVLRLNGIGADSRDLRFRHKLLSEIIEFPGKTTEAFYYEFNREFLRVLGVMPEERVIKQIYSECRNLSWKAYDDCTYLREINLPMGIISNWDCSLSQSLQLLPELHFDPILGSTDVGIAKPSAALYQLAIEKSGVKPEQILYAGDSVKLDMEPATMMGIKTVLIDRLDAFPAYRGLRIKSFSELSEVINNIT